PRQHPSVGRQVEDEKTVIDEAAVKLRDSFALVDIALAHNVGTEDRGKGSVAKWQRVDRGVAYRAPALRRGPRAGGAVGVEGKDPAAGIFGGEAGEQRTGAAAGVEQRLVAWHRQGGAAVGEDQIG